MAGSSPGSAREEAERLVVAALAAASLVARGASGRGGSGVGALGDVISSVAGHVGAIRRGRATGGFATGSAECCVCPVCRVIAALRDPSPELAERLATGAGDFAAGLASLLRSLSAAGTDHTVTPVSGSSGSSGSSGASAADGVWRAATRAGDDSEPVVARHSDDPWAAATAAPADGKTEKPAARKPEGSGQRWR